MLYSALPSLILSTKFPSGARHHFRRTKMRARHAPMSAPVRMPSKTPTRGVSGSRGHHTPRGKPRPDGVPGLTLCRIDQPATRHAPHNVIPGSPGRHDEVCSPGAEVGRRRAIGVVAAPPINPRATTPMARRWAAGTPMRHSGPEGRCREHGPEQRQRPGQWP